MNAQSGNSALTSSSVGFVSLSCCQKLITSVVRLSRMTLSRSEIQGRASSARRSSSHASLRGQKKNSVSGETWPREYTWSTATAMLRSVHTNESLYSGSGMFSSRLLENQSTLIVSQSSGTRLASSVLVSLYEAISARVFSDTPDTTSSSYLRKPSGPCLSSTPSTSVASSPASAEMASTCSSACEVSSLSRAVSARFLMPATGESSSPSMSASASTSSL
mmetsp:Transcript_32574/g.97210  ORF Transcript_32574/g.97210 Transcript_32574/m.97210 type:complete len:220 (-) Transcript_32574:522-1181(-)